MNNTEINQDVIDAVRLFVQKRITPIASQYDEQEEFPMEIFKELGKLDFLGIPFPAEYGGMDLGYATHFRVIQEVATACAATAMTIVAHSTLTCHPLWTFGTSAQKSTFLPPLISGDHIGAFALTEPSSGSDISSIKTVAVEQEDCFVLNGTKIFITNGNIADAFIVAAKTTENKGPMGISLFIVQKGIDGFSTSGKSEKKLGMRASDTAELVFCDVKVPKGNLIGKKNFGMVILHETLVTARLGMAAIAIGIAQAALAQSVQYIRTRKQFGKYLSHFQSVKSMIAEMEIGINAATLLLDKAVRLKTSGCNITKEASEAKLFSSQVATQTTKNAVQLFGAYGYSREFPLERYFRDAKLTEIGDGTSEIQKMIIADEVIQKKYKRPV